MVPALQGDQFEAWFQPQYNHVSGQLISAEALVRWRHPVKGLIPPNVFIPIFERNGFVYTLDQFIWKSCCIFLRKWLDEGFNPLPLSVNISRYDTLQTGFFETITGFVKQYSIPSRLLQLEITESAFAQNSDQIILISNQLRKYGFLVEIDDFGSGYSSLNILKDVAVDVLKLDMRFLESGNSSASRGADIIESVIRMAERLDLSVIAEGVETQEQADFLLSIGCLYIQGYLYARPMPQGDYEELQRQIAK